MKAKKNFASNCFLQFMLMLGVTTASSHVFGVEKDDLVNNMARCAPCGQVSVDALTVGDLDILANIPNVSEGDVKLTLSDALQCAPIIGIGIDGEVSPYTALVKNMAESGKVWTYDTFKNSLGTPQDLTDGQTYDLRVKSKDLQDCVLHKQFRYVDPTPFSLDTITVDDKTVSNGETYTIRHDSDITFQFSKKVVGSPTVSIDGNDVPLEMKSLVPGMKAMNGCSDPTQWFYCLDKSMFFPLESNKVYNVVLDPSLFEDTSSNNPSTNVTNFSFVPISYINSQDIDVNFSEDVKNIPPKISINDGDFQDLQQVTPPDVQNWHLDVSPLLKDGHLYKTRFSDVVDLAGNPMTHASYEFIYDSLPARLGHMRIGCHDILNTEVVRIGKCILQGANSEVFFHFRKDLGDDPDEVEGNLSKIISVEASIYPVHTNECTPAEALSEFERVEGNVWKTKVSNLRSGVTYTIQLLKAVDEAGNLANTEPVGRFLYETVKPVAISVTAGNRALTPSIHYCC